MKPHHAGRYALRFVGLNGRTLFLSSVVSWSAVVSCFPLTANALCCKCTIPSPQRSVCLTDDTVKNCNDLITASGNNKITDLTCAPTTLDDATCKAIASGGSGSCPLGPYQSKVFDPGSISTPGSGAPVALGQGPTNSAKIPGLVYAPQLIEESGYVQVPFLAQFISAIYKYLLVIAPIVASVMVIYGGFLYLLGESITSTSSGKKIIEDALIGLFLVFASYFILNTVNPDLVKAPVLKILSLKTESFSLGNANPTQRPGEDPSFSPTGSFDVSEDVKDAVPGNPKQIAEAIKAGAKEAGIDGCFLLAVCHHETKLANVWSGIQAKNPMEKGVAFGPCQIHRSLFTTKAGYATRLAAKYPDYPLEAEADAKIQWMLKHPEANAWIAGQVLQANVKRFNGNELAGIAGYGAGAKSLEDWQNANNCKPAPGKTVAQIVGTNTDEALKAACIPVSVAVGGTKKSTCPNDKNECADLKVNKTSEWVGHCPSDETVECYGMKTSETAEYVLRLYPQMKAQYQCG